MHIKMCVMAPTFMDVRTTQPMNALAKIPGVTTEMLIREMKVEPIKDKNIPHILILQRHIPQDAKAWKEKMLRVADMGWLVVSEWDDHPDKLPPGIRERFGEAGWMAFSAAHAVQTSTNYLKNQLIKYNENIEVFKNAVNRVYSVKNKENRIFFGALNREIDWEDKIDDINKFIEKNKNIGWTVILDRKFYNELKTDNKEYYNAMKYEEYINKMAKCKYAIMPLKENISNKCKSDIKFIESASVETIAIASETVYSENIINKENGYIIKDKENWRDSLQSIIEEKNIDKIKNNAKLYVQKYRLNHIIAVQRLNKYRELFRKTELLNNQLRRRI